MAILAECLCHKKQSTRNKLCSSCGTNLEKAKKSKKLRYWIDYRLPNGKHRREMVGFSIEEARDADGKRRAQKRENRIFDILPEARMTFYDLATWYLNLEKVKAMKYYPTVVCNLTVFNREFGNYIVGNLKSTDLENYQIKRKSAGSADATVDHATNAARAMVNKAFDNDLVGGNVVKVFKRVKRLLQANANARDKVLTYDEFKKLLNALPAHARPIFATGYYAGMRRGEVVNLTWDKVDLRNRIISLEATDTKTKRARKVAICQALYEILRNIPRAIHVNNVFLYKGKPIKDIRFALLRACRDSGIPYGRYTKDGLTFHDTRHCFNTNMRKAHIQGSVIMKQTGHSSAEMLLRYDTVDEDDIRMAVDQMQLSLEKVDQNVDQTAF